MHEHITTGQLSRLLGVPLTSIHNWLDKGLIRAAFNERAGRGNHLLFRLVPDALAIAVGVGMRGQGLTLACASKAMGFLQSLTAEDIEQAFSEGRGLLVVTGPVTIERLSSREEIVSSAVLAELARRSGVQPIAVDVQRVLNNILASLEREREPVSAG